MKNEAFRCIPILFEKIWGGHQLKTIFNKQAEKVDATYGESWEICDRPDAQSIVAEGDLKGKSLHELWMNDREELFGEGYDRFDRFPILCKILDAADNLSLQVHPTPKVAARRKVEEKNELWYVARQSPGAKMYIGMKGRESTDVLRNAITQNRLQDFLNIFELSSGESIFLPSGLIHGLGGGYVVFEIQQNSDATYRMYDWGRKDKDGKTRELHIEEALECVAEFEGRTQIRSSEEGCHLKTKDFQVEEHNLKKGDLIPHCDQEHFMICVIVQGSVLLSNRLAQKGDFIVVPVHAPSLTAGSNGAHILLITSPPINTCFKND